MRRKWFSLTMSAVLMLGLLSGCGSKDSNGGNSAASGENKNGNSSAEQVTIKWHSWYTDEEVQPIIKAFEAENPGIKVDYVTLMENGTSNESMNKLDMLMSSGEDMDVVHFNGPEPYSSRASLGLVEPLNSFFDKEGVKYEDEYKADAAIGGDIFAIPGSYEDRFVLLNKSYLDEAGLPVPTDWTWEEFQDYAKQLTKGEGANKRYGTYFHTWPEFASLWLNNQQENNKIVLSDGTVNVDNDLVRQSLQMRYNMENVDKTAVPYADAVSQKLHYRQLYMTGKVGMVIIGNWMAAESGGTEKLPATFQTVFAPYPRNSKEDPIGYNPAATDFLGISVHSKHKDEAYQFIRFYTTKGLDVQGKQFSAWNGQVLDKKIDDVLANALTPENVDKESLLYTMENSKSAKASIPPFYQAELDGAYKNEYELYLLHKQDLETTIQNSVKALQKIVDNNR